MTPARLSMLAALGALSLALAALLSACGKEENDAPFDDVDVEGRTTNPDGEPYPTEDLGGNPRSGEQPGNRIPNLTFRGYRDGDRSQGLQVLSLADYYDPFQKRNKLLHIAAVVAWCPHCRAETLAMAQAAPSVRLRGAEPLQALMEDKTGAAPSLADLDGWVTDYAHGLTAVFDSGGRRLSSIADLSAVPWNALIDTRSMEILSAGTGVPEDYEAYIGEALDWVESHPPRP